MSRAPLLVSATSCISVLLAGCTSAAVPIGLDGMDGGAGALVDATTDFPGVAASHLDGSVSDVEVESGPRCEGGAAVAVSPDAATCFIDLNQYDRSCSVDSDCVSTVELVCAAYQNSFSPVTLFVQGGNFCDGCNCNGGFGINQRAVAQYTMDISRTPEGSGQVAFPICNCTVTPPGTLACINGTCGLSVAMSDAASGD